MIKIFKTTDSGVLQISEFEDNSWISMTNPTTEELFSVSSTYKIAPDDLRASLDEEERSRIEIEEYYKQQPPEYREFPVLNSLIIGVDIDRELRRQKITRRLKQRLDEGMVDEVKALLEGGIASEDLIYYGLEYKYLTLYATGVLSFDDMFRQLETAIHQFAKRQMTWFRGMERRGFTIHWLDARMSTEEKVEKIMNLLDTKS